MIIDDKILQLAREWYHQDLNDIGEGMYQLQKLESTSDDHYWKDVLPTLRDLLSDIPFDSTTCDNLIIGRSVTEWEVKYALHLDATLARYLWMRRSFEGNGHHH